MFNKERIDRLEKRIEVLAEKVDNHKVPMYRYEELEKALEEAGIIKIVDGFWMIYEPITDYFVLYKAFELLLENHGVRLEKVKEHYKLVSIEKPDKERKGK